MKLSTILFVLSIVLVTSSCKNKAIQNSGTNKKYSNDLGNETSPYLLQHANNPVNWKPWNENSLSLAQNENKLIIVSIGYSACHWCHVMEEESFDSSNLKKSINLALKYALNLPLLWSSGNIETKRAVQYMLFPDGLGYDFQNKRIQTF